MRIALLHFFTLPSSERSVAVSCHDNLAGISKDIDGGGFFNYGLAPSTSYLSPLHLVLPSVYRIYVTYFGDYI